MSWKHLFARKELDTLLAEMAGEHQLRRVLGPVSLTSLGIGCIIGAGIFVLTGMAAADDGGPAIMVSFAVAAVGCALAALCYAEFAAMAPVAGSVYTYAYTTLGEIFAWIIGWDLMLEYSMGCATVASSWSGYLNEFLAVLGLPRVSPTLCSDPFTPVEGMAAQPWFNLPAVLIMAAVTVVLVLGIRESARINAVLVIVKVAVVLFIIAVGIGCVESRNWTQVPVTERVLPQERVLPGLVKEYLLSSGGMAADPASPEFQLRQKTLERQLAASYRLTWVRQENERLLQAGRLSREEAETRYQEIEAKVRRDLPAVADAAIIEKLLPQVEAEGRKKAVRSWGLLGVLGLDRWLLPIDDATRTSFSPYGLSGIMLGAAIVFFAFIGFDSISTHAEEARRPQRDVPIGILVSLVFCTLLYIIVSAVITGMVRYPDIDARAPIAVAFAGKAAETGSPLLRAATGLIAAGGLAGMTSVLLVLFLSQARVFMAMARDGLLPPVFGRVHPRWRTPHVATIVTGIVVCLIAALTPIRTLAEMVNIGTLLAFVIVCAAVMIIRVRRPDAHRPFRCPALFVIAPLGIVVNLALMLFLPVDTWLRLVIWLAIGFVVYFLYSRRHSRLGQHLLCELTQQGLSGSDAPLNGRED
jgi:APA family basic amino acid/polyamine antiporter